MKKIETILVGIDLEPDGQDVTAGSRRAAAQAKALATRTGARVTLFHSTARDEYWDPLRLGYVIVGLGAPPEGEKAMDALVDDYRDAGIETELVQHPDPAWLAITREALRGAVDLVVVGKRSRDERDGRKLGRVSQRLLRKCPCPVWVVKDDAAHADPQPRRILAATDLTPVGARVVQLAAQLAAQADAELHVLHVCPIARVPWSHPGGAGHECVEPDAEAAVANARKALQDQVDATPMRDSAQMHVVVEGPSEGILAAVREHDPDLLVMGTVSREGLAGFLIGNTAEWVLDQADCSLLTLKPERFVSPVRLHDEDRAALPQETGA